MLSLASVDFSELDIDEYDNGTKISDMVKLSSFKLSTLMFIQFCKNKPEQKYDIRTLSRSMGFKQRRFYEVISVFEALQICPKVDAESIIWHGFEKIPRTIEKIAYTRGVFYTEFSLADIFSNKTCVTVQNITEEFILLFIALEMRRINILEAASYLSKGNDRGRTTRCKLYQVAAILEIANIIRKTGNPSEFELLPEYFVSFSAKMNHKKPDPSNIMTLLNRPEPSCSDSISRVISSRLNEYYSQIESF